MARRLRCRTRLLLEALEQLLDQAGRVHLLLRRPRATRLDKLQLDGQQRQLELLARHREVVHAQIVARGHARQLRAVGVSTRRVRARLNAPRAAASTAPCAGWR